MNTLEVNPVDAGDRQIESGDWVEVSNDRVLIQTGGRHAAKFKTEFGQIKPAG